MNKTIITLTSALCLLSCDNETQTMATENATVRFNVSQLTSMLHNDTRSNLSLHAKNLTFIDRLSDGTYDIQHQQHTDATFGVVEAELAPGDHKLTFIAHSRELTYDNESQTASFDKTGDTFHLYMDLSVKPNELVEKTITLNRNVAKLEFVATDAIPANVGKMIIEWENASPSMSTTTGLGVSSIKQSTSIVIPEAYRGQKNIPFVAYTFLPTTEITPISVSISIYDTEDNLIKSDQILGLDAKINHKTICTGILFKTSTSFAPTIQINAEWGENFEYEI